MPIPFKLQKANEALQDYLEYAHLKNTSIALRNLVLRYVEGNEGHELWFEDFLPELDGLFEFFDMLQFIYPCHESKDLINRKRKSKTMLEATHGSAPETTPSAANETTPGAPPETTLGVSPHSTSEFFTKVNSEKGERIMRLSPGIRSEFYGFVTNTSVARLNRVLRDLVLAYLEADPREASHFFKSRDYKELRLLFYLFEIIEEEYTGEE